VRPKRTPGSPKPHAPPEDDDERPEDDDERPEDDDERPEDDDERPDHRRLASPR
jgi:hypothetical protein